MALSYVDAVSDMTCGCFDTKQAGCLRRHCWHGRFVKACTHSHAMIAHILKAFVGIIQNGVSGTEVPLVEVPSEGRKGSGGRG